MRYVVAKWKEKNKLTAYRIYVTDALFYQAQGKALNKRYADIIAETPVETRTSDEIIAQVRNRIQFIGESE